MSTKSRHHFYETQIKMSAERGKLARQETDKLDCVGWPQVARQLLGRLYSCFSRRVKLIS